MPGCAPEAALGGGVVRTTRSVPLQASGNAPGPPSERPPEPRFQGPMLLPGRVPTPRRCECRAYFIALGIPCGC